MLVLCDLKLYISDQSQNLQSGGIDLSIDSFHKLFNVFKVQWKLVIDKLFNIFIIDGSECEIVVKVLFEHAPKSVVEIDLFDNLLNDEFKYAFFQLF